MQIGEKWLFQKLNLKQPKSEAPVILVHVEKSILMSCIDPIQITRELLKTGTEPLHSIRNLNP